MYDWRYWRLCSWLMGTGLVVYINWIPYGIYPFQPIGRWLLARRGPGRKHEPDRVRPTD